MKKYLLYVLLILIGAIIGRVTTNTYALGKVLSDYMQIMETNSISDLEDCVLAVYSEGDFESSLIALNYYSEKLEYYKKSSKPESLKYDVIITKLGLTHGRLFLLYESKGEKDLAEQEYQKAIGFIGKKCKITSKDDLRKIIKKFDNTDKKSNIQKDKSGSGDAS